MGQAPKADLDESKLALFDHSEARPLEISRDRLAQSPKNSKGRSSPLFGSKPKNVFPVVRKTSQEKLFNESESLVTNQASLENSDEGKARTLEKMEDIHQIGIKDGSFDLLP